MLSSADVILLVGEMAPYTARAGQLYFPCGSPDPSDIDDRGTFDPTDHLNRELREEIGIGIDELDAEPGWTLVHDRCSAALMKRLISGQNAMIHAAGSCDILELSSSLNSVTCTLYVGRLNSTQECRRM